MCCRDCGKYFSLRLSLIKAETARAKTYDTPESWSTPKERCWKRGLQPNELKENLQDKLHQIVKQYGSDFRSYVSAKYVSAKENPQTRQDLNLVLNKAMKACAKKICLRVHQTNPGKLDHTEETLPLYSKVIEDALYSHTYTKSFGPGVKHPSEIIKFPQNIKPEFKPDHHSDHRVEVTEFDVPQKLQTYTSNQGSLTFSKVLNDKYHDEEKRFFTLLPNLLLELNMLVPERCISTDRQSDTEVFCIEIDYYTSRLILVCAKCIYYRNYALDDNSLYLLAEILLICEWIVMGRNIIDWVKANDLMSPTGKKTWKDHVKVIMSFLALQTALLALMKLFKHHLFFKHSYTRLLLDLEHNQDQCSFIQLIKNLLETIG